MKKIICLIALLLAVNVYSQAPATPTPTLAPVAVAAPAPQQPVDIEIILDASGSMAAKVGSESQMEIAKRAIKQTLTGIPPNVPVAFRVYAHRVPKSNQAESCKDTQLLVPFQPVNAAAFGTLVDSIKPNGYTPIAYSLKAAAQDFVGKESQYVIILISDGEETCGGDPVAEAKNLLAQGFKVKIDTIGFRADEKTRSQLSAISNATGGSYFDAKDAASLTQNLNKITQQELVADKPSEKARGQEIRGGNAYEDAKPLQTGIEYRLNHHQKEDQYDYFYVDLKKGEALTITLATMDKGIVIHDDGTTVENDSPSNGFRLMSPQFEELETIWTSGRHSQKEYTLVAEQNEKIYILIGMQGDSIHKNSPFKIEIKTAAAVETTTPPEETPAAGTPAAAVIAATPDAAAKKNQMYAWLAIGGAAFVGLLLIVAIILLMKKKK